MGTEIRTTCDYNPRSFLKLYKKAEGKLVSGKTAHKKVNIPPGVYEVTYSQRIEKLTGSDYCWLSYTYSVNVRSKKRPELIYSVEYSWGGDDRRNSLGKLSDSPLLTLEEIELMKGSSDD